MIGALLCPPSDPSCTASVIFFNNVGYLGMCGHGMIGTVVTLGHLGRIQAGTHRLETPVGVVVAEYDGTNTVEIANVPSYRFRKDVVVQVQGVGDVKGDVAWGGNWFFSLVRWAMLAATLDHSSHTPGNSPALTEQRITGQRRGDDHIELFAPSDMRKSQPQFRPLSRQSVRSLAMWHRHECENRVPRR